MDWQSITGLFKDMINTLVLFGTSFMSVCFVCIDIIIVLAVKRAITD